MWICAPLPLDGTSHGKLLIWLNLGYKGTHGGRLWNCNLSELHFSSLISLLAFLERLCLFFHKTTHSFLPRCKGRSPKRKFQSREEFFRGAVVSSLLIALAQALRLYLLKSSFHLTFQVKFSTSQNGLTVYCAGVPRSLIHWRPLWDFELVLRRQKHRQERVSTFQPFNVTALVDEVAEAVFPPKTKFCIAFLQFFTALAHFSLDFLPKDGWVVAAPNIEHFQGGRVLWSILKVDNLNWNQGLGIEMQRHCTFASTSPHLHLITLVACRLCRVVDT